MRFPFLWGRDKSRPPPRDAPVRLWTIKTLVTVRSLQPAYQKVRRSDLFCGCACFKQVLQLVCLIDCDQVVDKFVYLTIEYAGQVVARVTDTVVGHAILWEGIGTNLFAAITGLHLRTSRFAQLFLPARLF